MNNVLLRLSKKSKIKEEYNKKREDVEKKYKEIRLKEQIKSNLIINKSRQYRDIQLKKVKEETRWQVDINTKGIKGLNNIQKKGNEIINNEKYKENRIEKDFQEVVFKEKNRLQKELYLIECNLKKEESNLDREEKEKLLRLIV